MDKIRIDFFDIIGYLVPGTALLMVLWIAADSNVMSIWQIHKSIHSVDKKTVLSALFLAYLTGFILHAFGSFLYNLFNAKKAIGNSTEVQDKWALIREFGDKHVAILERWYALRALSQNLAAICLIMGVVCLSKWITFHYYEWLICLACSIILVSILLKRSKIFHNYLNDDIDSIMKLNLDKKAPVIV